MSDFWLGFVAGISALMLASFAAAVAICLSDDENNPDRNPLS